MGRPCSQAVPVDYSGGEGRGRSEEATIDDDDPDIPGSDDARVSGEKGIDGAEDDGLSLGSGVGHREVGGDAVDSLGEVSLVPEPRTRQDLRLKLHRGLVEAAGEPRVVQELGRGRLQVRRCLEAREVDEVHRPRTPRQVYHRRDRRRRETGCGEVVAGASPPPRELGEDGYR